MTKRQKVVWTYSEGYGRPTEDLEDLLDKGYLVKFITKRDNKIVEYIVEKEVEDD